MVSFLKKNVQQAKPAEFELFVFKIYLVFGTMAIVLFYKATKFVCGLRFMNQWFKSNFITVLLAGGVIHTEGTNILGYPFKTFDLANAVG